MFILLKNGPALPDVYFSSDPALPDRAGSMPDRRQMCWMNAGCLFCS